VDMGNEKERNGCLETAWSSWRNTGSNGSFSRECLSVPAGVELRPTVECAWNVMSIGRHGLCSLSALVVGNFACLCPAYFVTD
jgi:hypothetical protein